MTTSISRRFFLKCSFIASALSSSFLSLSCKESNKNQSIGETVPVGERLVRLPDQAHTTLFAMPVVLCGAVVNGKPNFNVLGNFGIVSLISPKPVIYISSNADHYTNIGIREHQEFSVCFPHVGILAKADYCGMYSGHKVDKSSIFKTQFGTLKFAPLIEEMHIGFACRVVQRIPVNSMEVFFGEIIEKFAASSCLTNGKPDPDKIGSVTYAPGVRYNSVGPTIGTPWSDYRNAQL